MTAVDALHDRVLPFYDEHHVEIEPVAKPLLTI